MCHDDVYRAASSRAASCRADGAGGRWAADALSHDDTTCRRWRVVSVSPGTPPGLRSRPKPRPGSPGPYAFAGVKTLGVDEHIWRPSRIGADRAVTIMVDLTRDQDGCLHARLLDPSSAAREPPKTWLQAQPDGFTACRLTGRVRSVPRLCQRDP